MGAHWYNPGDGDFTSADTVSVSPDPDSAAGNPFAYAADEPLDLVDPTGHYIVHPPNAGTSERVGNDVSSPSNFVADVATARVVAHAVITAPNNAAKAAAAHAALARVERQQATAHKAAEAAAAKAARAAAARAAAARAAAARKAAEQAAARKAAAQRAAAAARAPAFASGCSQRTLAYGACPSESGAAGTTSAEVKQAVEGAGVVLLTVFTGGLADALVGAAAAGEAGDAAVTAAEDAGAGTLRFTQTTASATFRNGPFAGRTIGDIAGALRSGAVKPSELPVGVITREVNPLIMNTRSSLALLRGGVTPAGWTINDLTGDPFYEELLTQRLANNGLTNEGTDMLRITGAGRWASWLG